MAKRKSTPKRPGDRRRTRSSSLSRPAILAGGNAAPGNIPDLLAVIHQLDIIVATVGVARSALTYQAADGDLDIATVLRRQVMEPLSTQIDRLRKLLPENKT